MKFLEDLDGDNITTIIIVIAVVTALITLTCLIRSCNLEEKQQYLNAGCEHILVPGRQEAIWGNCKKPLEKIQ